MRMNTISGADTEKSSKRTKHTRTNTSGLSFEPSKRPASYSPSTLAESDFKTYPATPFTLRLGKGSFEVSGAYSTTNGNDDTLCFWTELATKVETLEPILKDQHFGVISKEDIEQLKLASNLNPTLLGQDGRCHGKPGCRSHLTRRHFRVISGSSIAAYITLGLPFRYSSFSCSYQSL